MKSQDILFVGVYNRIHDDRTQWYSVSDEVMELYLGEFRREESGQGGQKEGAGERPESPKAPEEKSGKAPIESAGEEPFICPPGQMDVAEVPHPSAPGGAWMRRNRHMEAANSPDRSGGIATTIPYNKPINKPAVAAEKNQRGQMARPVEKSEAAAGFFDIEKLKADLLRINRKLVFDESFYPKALEYLAAQGFDGDYLSWLYGECRNRKPDNLRGLYFTLFDKEDMAALYRNVEKERRKAKSPPPQKTCPCCGTMHPACLERCPECELEKADEGDPAKIARQRKFHRLPRKVKDEYAEEQWALFSQAFKSGTPLAETKAQWIMLDKKYHLLE
ncbi:MAG: hypothetical protein LBQ14_04175 [Treponema sp.]|nr:hypothetical protein [Treponema sp.]